MTLTADTEAGDHGETTDPLREGLVEIDGEGFYAIPNVDEIPPFLMSVVSDGDRWMFVSSVGPLTAGRRDAAGALFPYETDDRLHAAVGRTGPSTVFRVRRDGGDRVWRPFHDSSTPTTRRSLYKSVVGDRVIFEEVHHELELTFRYRWATSERFGFVRTATLENMSDSLVSVEYVDGLLNLLPHGLQPAVYQRMNNLTNAYKRSEVIDPKSRLAIFSLESGIVDRPEPAEVLRGTAVWSIGPADAEITVTPDALADLASGGRPGAVSMATGRPGAYLLEGSFQLEPGKSVDWHIVADVGQEQSDVVALQAVLDSEPDLQEAVTSSVDRSAHSLVEIMAPADALQRTGDRVATAHQFANVTYNVMRGGVPLNGYEISTRDFGCFLASRNRRVTTRHEEWIRSLPETIDRDALLDEIRQAGDPQLRRLGQEYLPFSFARRHGDPSRPWNAFSIRVRDTDGEPILYYEGNWRDIFQNWEALCMSFPEFLPGVISVFVDASTPDGFNPYRITREGIDWEVPDPDDPWSGIGYWGDHQIVYLLRLLEASDRFLPSGVAALLDERLFSYADVPYRISPYDDIVRDPKATIHYDQDAAAASSDRVSDVGGDGRLVMKDGEVYLVTLAEKLVVPVLSKLSNFVPGGGIWMNTERPEWNDANNALVGFGLSMVTLYQLRRYLDHLRTLVGGSPIESVQMSAEVARWLGDVIASLRDAAPEGTDLSATARKALMDRLGRSFEGYRSQVYASGFSGSVEVRFDQITALCDVAITHLDATIQTNRRTDGLFHSYNLVRFGDDGSSAEVDHLFEMLEGQVAILDSGVLSPGERLEVIEALFSSKMYRADQKSFILYPARELPSFLDKNVVPAESVTANPLLTAMLAANDGSVITVDASGRHRFNADFANGSDLEATLTRLEDSERWRRLVSEHRRETLALYEEIFEHHAYTGRSGSMYGYEGIGSIYWHMVAKLLVAIQASVTGAITEEAQAATTEGLIDAYWRVRAGLGFNKSAADFGAIPLDPYSHTPAHAGAQQPGMTGLVKEELLTRPLEVGVRVDGGEIVLDPTLLRRGELLESNETWELYDTDLEALHLQLDAGSLGMTFCQVPVVISLTSGEPSIDVTFADGTTETRPGLGLGAEISAQVFSRAGTVVRIHGHVPDRSVTQ